MDVQGVNSNGLDSSSRNSDLQRMVVVSNRLPVSVSRREDGGWDVTSSSGGLVSALKHILQERSGLWIGWPGVAGDDEGITEALDKVAGGEGYQLGPVSLTEEQIQNYYFGFSNEVIWPLFHDMASRCSFQPDYWASYQEVNSIFARTIARNTNKQNFVWVQDYHLMMVARYLRALGAERHTGFFLHIPFPPLDVFLKMPWRFEILQALLEYDTIGLQTVRDTRNFVNCVRNMLKGVRVARRQNMYTVSIGDRVVSVGNFPIGIDFDGFDQRARSDAVTEQTRSLRENLPDRQLIVGIDRLDYTKGVPERLYAFQNALRRYPDLIENVTLIQVVVPSREIVAGYREMREEVERLVSEINGEFTSPGWVPVHYHFRSMDPDELVAYYRASEMSLVTPVKDGMNLISKEYAASNVDENGTLILSEFAGSAAQLHSGAIMVNPHDVVGTADAIYRAFVMTQEERRERMQRLRRNIKQADVFWWTNSYLALAIEGDFSLKPAQSFYVPNTDVNAPAPRSDIMIVPDAET